MIPPVDDALVKDSRLVTSELVVSEDAVVVASVVVPNATRLVVVALVVVKLVNTEVTAERREEKNPVVEVLLVATRLLVTRVLDTVRAVADAA